MSESREGPLRSWMGITSKMTVTIIAAAWGVVPHVLIHAGDTHPPLETIEITCEYALAFT